ncbi:MAG: hypothetical protein RDV41_12625, partial [Planctomycetota bacterium]|nr:hypothetical protein [Planctomycetota bacterium]
MRTSALVIGLTVCFFFLSAIPASADEWWEQFGEGCGRDVADQVVATKALNDEMSLLNLINGLYLTEPQIKVIADCAAEAGKARESFVANNIGAVKDFRASLEELKSVLEKNAGIPKDLEERVNQRETAVLKVKSDYFARLKELQDRVDSTLSDGQKSVIADFNPCIIPPENLKNPVRVGQASDTSELE